MNSVILIGRLTRDPELRYIPGSGKAVANFDIAVDRQFSKEKETDFFKVQVWGKMAENCANYLAKGSQAGIRGRLQNRSYETKEGEKRYITEIIAEEVQFLGTKGEKKEDNAFKPDEVDGFRALDDDDVPF